MQVSIVTKKPNCKPSYKTIFFHSGCIKKFTTTKQDNVTVVMKSSAFQNNKTKFLNEKEGKWQVWFKNNCDGSKQPHELRVWD